MKRPNLRPLVLLPQASMSLNRPPPGFSTLECSPEQKAHLNKLTIETFLELANRGNSFADCLGAVLLTGMNFATEIATEKT